MLFIYKLNLEFLFLKFNNLMWKISWFAFNPKIHLIRLQSNL